MYTFHVSCILGSNVTTISPNGSLVRGNTIGCGRASNDEVDEIASKCSVPENVRRCKLIKNILKN